jgi:hypothetical protein
MFGKNTPKLTQYCSDTKTSKGKKSKTYFHEHTASGLNMLPHKASDEYKLLVSKLSVKQEIAPNQFV